MLTSQRGSSLVEFVGALVLVSVLAIGIIEVALALYARNVVISSVHDGARAALEYQGDVTGAEAAAERTIRHAAGGLARDIEISVGTFGPVGARAVQVRAEGSLRIPGPLPLPLPVSITTTVQRESAPR